MALLYAKDHPFIPAKSLDGQFYTTTKCQILVFLYTKVGTVFEDNILFFAVIRQQMVDTMIHA